jgi:hypothetical protein
MSENNFTFTVIVKDRNNRVIFRQKACDADEAHPQILEEFDHPKYAGHTFTLKRED